MPMRIQTALTVLTLVWMSSSPLIAQDLEDQVSEASAALTASSRQALTPMTGRVLKDRVRLRNRPDRDAPVIMELHKDDLVLIDGLERDFFVVQPLEGMKAYVFRSYILDGSVEASNVNVRQAPSLDSTIVGRLQQGDRVEGEPAAEQNKWLQIRCPATCRFFVAKELIEQVGGAEIYAKMGARQGELHQLLHRAEDLAQQEMLKTYDAMRLDEVQALLERIGRDFRDFPSHAERARSLLSKVQHDYLSKKAAFLGDDHLMASTQASLEDHPVTPAGSVRLITDRMRLWEPIEHGLIESWMAANPEQTPQDFYSEEQRLSTELEGILEPFASTGNNRPGDYVLKYGAVPVAYVYSTSVNLQDQVGRKVRVLASPRPNHHYAFPAYFVHQVDVLPQN